MKISRFLLCVTVLFALQNTVDAQVVITPEDEKIAEAVKKVFDLRPAAIIETLKLRRPIYRQLSAYGHMGRTDLDVEWEKTDRTEELKKALGN